MSTSLGRVVQARARLQSAGLQVCTVVERVGAGPQLAPNGELFSVVSCFSGMSHASGASALSLSPATTKMGLELSTSGIAVCTATAFTNPIDVVKIRIQLASSSQGAGSLGVFSTGAAVIRNEGACRVALLDALRHAVADKSSSRITTCEWSTSASRVGHCRKSRAHCACDGWPRRGDCEERSGMPRASRARIDRHCGKRDTASTGL